MVKFWFQSGDLEREVLSGQVIIKFKRKPFKVIMGCGDMVILGIKSDLSEYEKKNQVIMIFMIIFV